MTRPRKSRLLTGRLAASADRAFLRLAFRDGRRGAPEREQVDARPARDVGPAQLVALGDFYLDAARRGALFVELDGPPTVARHIVAEPRGRAVIDLTWPSRYAPLHADFEDALRVCPQNRTCHARWFRHASPRPAIVLLHGWGGGHYGVEARAFPVRWLHRRLGLDVLLMTLPFHARRRARRGSTPPFPSSNPVRANEGFAQAVHDVRSLVAWLASHHGTPTTGVAGMSLGGFTTALLATTAPELAFAAPLLPFGSMAHMLWAHGAHTRARARAVRAGVRLEHLEHAFAATTPLLRQLAVEPGRVLIVAGEHDLVTPIDGARRLHDAFDGAKFATYPGAHLLQLGRGAMFRALGRHLSGLALTADAR